MQEIFRALLIESALSTVFGFRKSDYRPNGGLKLLGLLLSFRTEGSKRSKKHFCNLDFLPIKLPRESNDELN